MISGDFFEGKFLSKWYIASCFAISLVGFLLGGAYAPPFYN